MSIRSRMHSVVAALILAAAPGALTAQWQDYPTSGVPRTADGKPNFSAPAPRTADGKPDLSGMWGWVTIGPPCGSRCTDLQIGWEFLNIAHNLKTPLPYQPWAAELVKKRKADNAKDDPNVRCMPRGALRIWTDDYYKRIYTVPDRVVILTERNMQYRQIFTDGRPLAKDADPWWYGYSTGHWEGDTLVVESAGFRDLGWLDVEGSPLTDAGRITERYRRPSFGHLEIEVTINDPKAYTKPWTVTVHQHILADTEIIEFVCQENEKDAPHLK